MKFRKAGLVLGMLLAGLISSFGFALLGLYADWMDLEKGYQVPRATIGFFGPPELGAYGDIGGPMDIGEDYRRNVPVITYGFDRSFLNYFGSNGVAAVEGAIGILNQLPPASPINLQNFPLNARTNHNTQVTNLVDLKSMVLCALVEQLGLADPERYVFTVRDFYTTPPSTNYIFDIIQRNFDPVTAQPTSYINNILLSYRILQYSVSLSPPPTNIFCFTHNYPVDASQPLLTTVASQRLGLGEFLTGLSRDDAGGFRYLLSGNQVRFESLPPDVSGIGTNAANFVSAAYRPGIEKISFVRHPTGALSGAFEPYTNQWTDVYYDAGNLPDYQEVQRVTTQPDIVFSGADLGTDSTGPAWTRSGTTNWVNNADTNGNPGGAGPGVIQGPVTITFNTGGSFYLNVYNTNIFDDGLEGASAYTIGSWGSYDSSTNPPITYPDITIGFQPTQVSLQLSLRGKIRTVNWPLAGAANARFDLQTGTNLTDWTTLTVLTNSGSLFNYQFQAPTNEPRRFFRAKQEP